MQKYIAYEIFVTNEYGAAVAGTHTDEPRGIYLASDVDARIAEHNKDWEDAAKERVQHLTNIAELEKALRDAIVWNWAEWTSHDPKNPPAELVDRISTLLASKPLMVNCSSEKPHG